MIVLQVNKETKKIKVILSTHIEDFIEDNNYSYIASEYDYLPDSAFLMLDDNGDIVIDEELDSQYK